MILFRKGRSEQEKWGNDRHAWELAREVALFMLAGAPCAKRHSINWSIPKPNEVLSPRLTRYSDLKIIHLVWLHYNDLYTMNSVDQDLKASSRVEE